MRKCLKCKIEKPATSDFFYRDKNRPLGIMYVCKICDKERTKLQDRVGRYGKMTDEQKKTKRITCKKYSSTEKGRAIHLQNAYRKNDIKKGRICDITTDDILIAYNSNCVYCGYKSTGFDRLDNSIGHIKSNCVPCCKECNIARMDNFTHKEMFLLGDAIKKIKDIRNNGLKYPKL
jgi:hypothetical protein